MQTNKQSILLKTVHHNTYMYYNAIKVITNLDIIDKYLT